MSLAFAANPLLIQIQLTQLQQVGQQVRALQLVFAAVSATHGAYVNIVAVNRLCAECLGAFCAERMKALKCDRLG